jgi:hypothetical protein
MKLVKEGREEGDKGRKEVDEGRKADERKKVMKEGR